MYSFRYRRAGSVQEAVSLLADEAEAQLLAGGQTLIPTLKLRMGNPTQLIDIGQLDALRGIRLDGETLSIGAATTHAEVAGSPEVRHAIPALALLAAGIGDPMVRNMGTIGGSLAYNHPGADYPGAVLGLGAIVVTDRRSIAADEFFAGMLSTVLEATEVIVAVRFPLPLRAGYIKFRSPASGYVLAGAFVAELAAGVRVAINGAGPCAFRQVACEQALTEDFSVSALDGIELSADGLLEDLHAGPQYRAQLARVAVQRAVMESKSEPRPAG